MIYSPLVVAAVVALLQPVNAKKKDNCQTLEYNIDFNEGSGPTFDPNGIIKLYNGFLRDTNGVVVGALIQTCLLAFADASCTEAVNLLPIDGNGNYASQIFAQSNLFGVVGGGAVVGGRGEFKCSTGTFEYNRVGDIADITVNLCVNPDCF